MAHKELITTVPSIGMQFANDCLYVSREGGRACRMRLRELGQQRSDAGSQEKQAERVREARRAFQHMRSTGEAVMDNQLVSLCWIASGPRSIAQAAELRRCICRSCNASHSWTH